MPTPRASRELPAPARMPIRACLHPLLHAARRETAIAAMALGGWTALASSAFLSGEAPAAGEAFAAIEAFAAVEEEAPNGAAFCAHARAHAHGGRPLLADRTEPTPNQRRWDALSYALDLRLEPDSSWIGGTARIRLRCADTMPPFGLESVELDLADSIEVTQVRLGGTPLPANAFRHEGDILAVALPEPLAPEDEATLAIAYEGRVRGSSTDGLHFRTINGRPLVYSFGGPRGARRWWPCKDHPEDKADTVSIRARVPAGMELVANGTLTSRREEGAATVFEWRETHPIATYLVAIAAYPYSVYQDEYAPPERSAGHDAPGMPVVFYNFPESRASWEPVQARVVPMIGACAGLFGEYPFLDEKYGHAQIPFSGGMEHQTITSLGSNQELVVLHELAHQWWGDEVTCASFEDIWLNEGFATYSEALWQERQGGREAYRERMRSAEYFGPGTIRVDRIDDPRRIYDYGLSYSKGAWVLHMLRHIAGDGDFFRILREYRARQRDRFDGVATTLDLAAVASQVSGRDLRPFFQRWIEGEGYPIYRYDWTASPAEGMWRLSLRIRQMQDGPVFSMPIDIEVHSPADLVPSRATVWNATADTTYTLSVPEEPATVELDPEGWILRRLLEPMPKPTFQRPLLLVNGVPWSGEDGARMRALYADAAFTGGREHDFWDYHPEPAAGYPASLPAPIGHGEIPGEVLARYRAVIWVGNLFGGDDRGFRESPMHAYLEAGGNLLLMTLGGRSFLLDPYREYLGIEWAAGDSAATSYRAMQAGLPDLRLSGLQSGVSFFRVDPGNDKVLLFADRGDPSRGLGVVRLPELDAALRAAAEAPGSVQHACWQSTAAELPGRFVFLSGRAYRWNADDLAAAMRALIPAYLLATPNPGVRLETRAPWPNPSRAAARLAFLLPQDSRARLALYDATGREVRVLRDGPSPAGWNAEVWDGRDAGGRRAPSGVYFARVVAGDRSAVTRVVRIR